MGIGSERRLSSFLVFLRVSLDIPKREVSPNAKPVDPVISGFSSTSISFFLSSSHRIVPLNRF